MYLARPTSAIKLILMLLTAECCCRQTATAKSSRIKTETRCLRSTTSDYLPCSDDRRPVTLLSSAAPSPFTVVRRKSFFPGSRKLTDAVDSESVDTAIFAWNSTAGAWKSRRIRKASRWLIRSPIRGRVSADDGGRTARRKQPTHRDASRRPAPEKRRRGPTVDDARRLHQRQVTWSTDRDAVGEKSRRRPPLPTDNVATEVVSQQAVDASARELAGWSGDPEVIRTLLVHKVSKDTDRKYFVGKRHPAQV